MRNKTGGYSGSYSGGWQISEPPSRGTTISREEVWLSTWLKALEIHRFKDSATRIADYCLEQFDERFHHKDSA